MTKIPDSVIVGYPAWREPRVLGEIAGHGLTDCVVGQIVRVRDVEFVVNVSYVPAMPGKKAAVPILEPREEIPSSFWADGERVVKTAAPKQEEMPF